jgi:hypothetical protein
MPEEVPRNTWTEPSTCMSRMLEERPAFRSFDRSFTCPKPGFPIHKFGMEFPDRLGSECGLKSKAALVCKPVCSNENPCARERSSVNDLVLECHGTIRQSIRGNTPLPPTSAKYDTIVPLHRRV